MYFLLFCNESDLFRCRLLLSLFLNLFGRDFVSCVIPTTPITLSPISVVTKLALSLCLAPPTFGKFTLLQFSYIFVVVTPLTLRSQIDMLTDVMGGSPQFIAPVVLPVIGTSLPYLCVWCKPSAVKSLQVCEGYAFLAPSKKYGFNPFFVVPWGDRISFGEEWRTIKFDRVKVNAFVKSRREQNGLKDIVRG